MTQNKVDRQLDEIIDAFGAVGGEFIPFSYALGLRFDPRSTLEYGVEAADGNVLSIPDQLTFRHELCHLLQFTGSTLGLDAWRLMHHAYRGWGEGAPWKTPIRIDSRTSFKAPYFLRLVEFSHFYSRELLSGIKVGDLDLSLDARRSPSWYSFPYNPLHSIIGSSEGFQDKSNGTGNQFVDIAASIRDRNLKNISVQYYEAIWKSRKYRIELNAVSILETCAVISEIFAFIDMMRKGSSGDIQGLPEDMVEKIFKSRPPLYWAALEVFKSIVNISDSRNILIYFAAAADIALMYTNITIKNARAAAIEKEKFGGYESVFSVFLRAADAIQNVEPLRNVGLKVSDEGVRHELQRFQDDVTKLMGLPSVKVMEQIALEKAKERFDVVQSVGDATTSNNYASIEFHIIGLTARIAFGGGSFLASLLPDAQDQIFVYFKNRIEVYDFETRESSFPNVWHNQFAGISDLIYQSLTQEKLTCPFKEGRIYFCPARDQRKRTCRQSDLEDFAVCPLTIFRGINTGTIKSGSIVLRDGVNRFLGKVGRNEMCPCGSGKKFKRCCGRDRSNVF